MNAQTDFAQTDFAQSITEIETRFAALSEKAMTTEITADNASNITGALIMFALGGFMNRRLQKLHESIANANASVNSTDPEEAFSASMILESSPEVGATWQSIATAFLSTGENLLKGVVPEAEMSGAPIFHGQFIDSALVANSIQLEGKDATEAARNFKAWQYAKISNFIYGILIENENALGKIHRDSDIGAVYDKFDQLTLDESIEQNFEVVLPALFYIANQAKFLADEARELAPFSATQL